MGEAETPAAPRSNWTYDEDRDEMRGTSTRFASVRSLNNVPVNWPYTAAPATLHVRHRSTDGLNIFITIDGQFTCRQYRDQTVAVKFDDGPIQQFRCGEADGGGSDMLFILAETRFLNAMKEAEKVTIELPVYEIGPTQMTFPVAGLEWE